MLTPADYLEAARAPRSLEPQEFGLWTIRRVSAPNDRAEWPDMTILHHMTMASMHLRYGEVVMEDSAPELRRHLPIWIHGRGRVLVTGLGLGCVVRGLLAKPEVSHIDVLEIERELIDRVGAEFTDNPRVTLHHADAETFPLDNRWWDFAWHDLLTEGNIGLAQLHARIIRRFAPHVGQQGAWAFPRIAARYWPGLLGQPRRTSPSPICRVEHAIEEAEAR